MASLSALHDLQGWQREEVTNIVMAQRANRGGSQEKPHTHHAEQEAGEGGGGRGRMTHERHNRLGRSWPRSGSLYLSPGVLVPRGARVWVPVQGFSGRT